MAVTQTLTPLPDAPDPAVDDNSTYAQKATAFTQALVTFRTEMSNVISQINSTTADINAGLANALRYTFSTTTTDSDPGGGTVRLSSGSQSSSTVVRMDLLDAGGSTVTAILDSFDDSTSGHKGILRLQHSNDTTKWLSFNVTGVAAPSGYRNVQVTLQAASAASPFVNGDPVTISFSRTGDLGAGGLSTSNLQRGTYTYFTTGGTGAAYTLTPNPALTSYDAGTQFDVVFNSESSASPTISISSLNAISLMKMSPEGYYETIAAGDIPYQWRSRVQMLDTSSAVVLDLPPPVMRGSAVSHRNKIRNGKFSVNQSNRLPLTGVSGNQNYIIDGWVWANSTTASVNLSTQGTILPSNQDFGQSIKVVVNTADATLAASEAIVLQQSIEGSWVYDLIGKPFSISFQVYSSKPGTYAFALRNSGSDRSYVIPYTISSANTWQRVVLKVPQGLITDGTWNWTTGIGLTASFVLACGTTYRSAAGGYTWETGNYIGISGMVNFVDTAGATFMVTGVQIEKGSVPGPFEHMDYALELLRNQRYYESGGACIVSGWNNAGGAVYQPVQFKATKRAPPSVTPTTGGSSNASGLAVGDWDVSGFRVGITIGGAGAGYITFSWVASSEL